MTGHTHTAASRCSLITNTADSALGTQDSEHMLPMLTQRCLTVELRHTCTERLFSVFVFNARADSCESMYSQSVNSTNQMELLSLPYSTRCLTNKARQ